MAKPGVGLSASAVLRRPRTSVRQRNPRYAGPGTTLLMVGMFFSQLFCHFIFAYRGGVCNGTKEECEAQLIFNLNIYFTVFIAIFIYALYDMQRKRWLKWKRTSNKSFSARFIKWLKSIHMLFPSKNERQSILKNFRAWLKLYFAPYRSENRGK